MTTPIVPADLSEVVAQISQIESRLRALAAPSSGAAFGAVFTDAVNTSTGTTVSNGASGTDVVNDAKKYLGVPYVWGGESMSGIDCSGLVQAAYRDVGVSLPRVAADQAHSGTPVASLAQAQPGDLLFFGDPAYHVAIYLGDNKLIESPEPGKSVHITDVYQQPTSIRRILSPAATSTSSWSAAGISSAVAAYASQFASAEARFNLPSGLLAAVAQQESGGNASAVSPAGAEGLMQLMPSTAAGYGVDPFDPNASIVAAAKILSGDLHQFGNSVPLALAAYNAGAGAVSQYGGVPPYAETQNYVARIESTLAAGG